MAEKFEHKKSLGQHFLTSPVVPNWMCDAADITLNDIVVEIGPGTGVLTKVLLERGARVIALEADERAITILQDSFETEVADGQLTIMSADVREFDWHSLGLANHSYKVVANIPYYLSGLLFRTTLENAVQPNTLVFLVQKEVAKRATSDISRGEKESLLSLSVKSFGEPAYIKTVSRGHFNPPPQVDSGIIAVRNINQDNFTKLPSSFFFNLLHLGFGQKRKQLLGNLTHGYDRGQLAALFAELSIPATIRAEDLDIATWLTLAHRLYHA